MNWPITSASLALTFEEHFANSLFVSFSRCGSNPRAADHERSIRVDLFLEPRRERILLSQELVKRKLQCRLGVTKSIPFGRDDFELGLESRRRGRELASDFHQPRARRDVEAGRDALQFSKRRDEAIGARFTGEERVLGGGHSCNALSLDGRNKESIALEYETHRVHDIHASISTKINNFDLGLLVDECTGVFLALWPDQEDEASRRAGADGNSATHALDE